MNRKLPWLWSPVISDARVRELYVNQHERIHKWTDRLFGWLLIIQWLAAIGTAMWISPLAWAGTSSQIHPHIYTAVILGFVIIALPVGLARWHPGWMLTRQVIAVAQALMSALLIHLTGGRIETHFHVFASLALLACYRDVKVLITASVVVALDHFVRGLIWPESVYGTSIVSPWRFAEHAGWVVVEDLFLFLVCRQGLAEMLQVAERQARLESMHKLAETSNEQLREEIAQRERTQQELARAKTVAEAANHAKSEFLANMSHELRTPLNAIIGFSDVLRENIYGPLNSAQQTCIDDVLESGQHLLSLVNDILDLAKIESGTMDMQWEHVDLSKLVLRLVQISRERAVRSGIQIACDVSPDLTDVMADERRLKQLLYNYISNALKFTSEGGEVRIDAVVDGDDIIIRISDTGVGIPTAEQERIFETFYQVDSTLTKDKQGTGLGLALVRRIADLHDGLVWVESEVGVGSSFFFRWPGCRPRSVVEAELCRV